MSAPATTPVTNATKAMGMKKNGKNWHGNKKPFRPTSGLTSYAKRVEERKQLAAIKEREREMKEEKEAERQAGSTFTPWCDSS
ncbi:rRNA-processing protein cgr1 [Paecilomyces lecythidis]